jgi:hypothetical protein
MIEPSTSARRALVAGVALAAALAAVPADAAGSTAARRIAVVVGANRAPAGRPSLRYAHSDAEEIARVLIDVAAFAPDDVHVLLDPTPGAVLRGLDSALATLAGQDEALLFFYYSGHSDAGSLYPAGQPLPLSELKRRLEDSRASVRVGVVDACSGGAWTGAKGVHPAEPFVVEVPFTLGAEGSALLAASSGAENANEYERIGGSFFTHHLVAGLRGGAERDEGLRRGVHRDPGRSLRAVRREGDSAAYEKCQQANPAIEMSESRGGQDGSGRDSDEGMDGVPRGIHGRNFVRQKLHGSEHAGGGDYPPFPQYAQIAGEMREAEVLEQAERQDAEVELEAGEPGGAHCYTPGLKQVHRSFQRAAVSFQLSAISLQLPAYGGSAAGVWPAAQGRDAIWTVTPGCAPGATYLSPVPGWAYRQLSAIRRSVAGFQDWQSARGGGSG